MDKNSEDENKEEQDWIGYLEQNFVHEFDKSIPFPGSSWSKIKKESAFNHEDKLKHSDERLHEEVLNALYQAKDVDASLVIIDVINGHVSLRGTVFSAFAREKAREVASAVEGVWKVDDELNIQNCPT